MRQIDLVEAAGLDEVPHGDREEDQPDQSREAAPQEFVFRGATLFSHTISDRSPRIARMSRNLIFSIRAIRVTRGLYSLEFPRSFSHPSDKSAMRADGLSLPL